MKFNSLFSCVSCRLSQACLVILPVLLVVIIGELSSETQATRVHKRHPGKSLYTRKYANHKHHKRGKSKHHGKYYSNTWAVHFHPPHRHVAERITKKHGFEILGQVFKIIRFFTWLCWYWEVYFFWDVSQCFWCFSLNFKTNDDRRKDQDLQFFCELFDWPNNLSACIESLKDKQ